MRSLATLALAPLAVILGAIAALALLVLAPLGWLAGCATAAPSSTIPRPSAAKGGAGIDWLPWEPASFARARADDKLILVDVGMEGCTACRWMNEDTYQDADVVARVRESFVAIQVDAEARRDVGERYSEWAWPATIFLLPDGTQVLALRGNKRPHNFIPILDDLVTKKRAGALRPDSIVEAPTAPDVTDVAKLRDALDRRLLDLYDVAPMKRPINAPLRVAALHATHGDDGARARVINTASKSRALIDPVWGGAFVGALEWRQPIVEKRIGGQAAVLHSVAEAYALKPDAALVALAVDVDRYVASFLLADDGTFFTSQRDEVRGLPSTMTSRDYYALDDAARRAIGVPPIDHAVYTDQNGMLIEAYARLAEVTGDARFLARAERAAQTLVATRLTNAGWFRQASSGGAAANDARMRALVTEERPYLSAQASMGLALLQLYRVTLDPTWLETAKRVAGALSLLDAPQGGLYAAGDDGTGALLGRAQPFDDNGKAALFLIELGTVLRDKDIEARGARVLAALAARSFQDEGLAIGWAALAAHAAADDLVEVTVVARDAPRELVEDAKTAATSPGVFVRVEPPGHYPDLDKAVVFVCTDRACSPPLEGRERIRAAVERSLREHRSNDDPR